MVIADLHVLRIRSGPAEADAPLVIDSDRMLADAVAFESLQPVSWRDSKIL